MAPRIRDTETFSNEALFKIFKKDPLPERAKAKLFQTRAQADAYEATLDSFWAQNQQSQEKLRKLKARHDRADNDDEREFVAEQIADLEKQIADLAKAKTTAGAISFDFSDEQTRQAVKLAKSGAPLKDFSPELPEDTAGDVALLEKKRTTIAGFQKQIADLEHSIGDPVEIMKRLERDLNNFAAAGTPDFAAFVREERQADGSYAPFGPVRWPRVYSGNDQFLPDGFHFVCWLMKDELRKRIEKEIAAKVKGKTFVPLADRPALIKKLEANVLLEERAECALVWRLHEAGRSDIQFRSDVSAKAYLGLRVGKVGR